jgi:hypothetical protein
MSDNGQEHTQIVEMLQKMQQQMNFLEKKLDQLLQGQGGGQKSFGDRPFKKPFRPFGGGNKFGGGGKPFRRETPGFGSHRDGGEGRPRGPWQGRKKPFFGNKRERNQ